MCSEARRGQYAQIVARLRAAGCVFAEDEARLLLDAAQDAAQVEAMVNRRAFGEPLEYIVGWARFRGVRYRVLPGVFVPRHRTEFLVEQAVRFAQPEAVVVDLCCGCGALGAALQREVPVQLHCADIDPAAVQCARDNVTGEVHLGDLFTALPPGLRGTVDVLLANAPYVPTDDIGLMPPEAREHEARAALDGGADGTSVQRRILADAASWLAPAGRLLTETTEAQLPRLTQWARASGLVPQAVRGEDATVLVCARAG